MNVAEAASAYVTTVRDLRQLDNDVLLREILMIFCEVQLHSSENLDLGQQNIFNIEHKCPPLFIVLLLVSLIHGVLEIRHPIHDSVNFPLGYARCDHLLRHMGGLGDKQTLLIDDVLLVADQKIVHTHLGRALIDRGGLETDRQRRHV